MQIQSELSMEFHKVYENLSIWIDFKKLEQSFEQRLRSQAEQFEVERRREREEREQEREQERELFLTKFTELANQISSLKGSEVSLPTIVSRTSETPTPMEVVNESLVSSKVFYSSPIHIIILENIYYNINIILSSSWACRIIRSLDYWQKMVILLLLDE